MTLTSAEKREFDRQYRHALRGRIELDGLTFPPSEQLVRCVESIVASRERAAAEKAWDAACEAFAWCMNNGPGGLSAVAYVHDNNPYRAGEIRNG